MSILISWLGPLRAICMAIDGIAYSLLDQAYNLVIKLSTAELFQHETIRSITNNLYILIGVVAFFRLALVLVNAIIDPEKLNEKGKGLSNIFFRVVGMIILLAVTPFLFQLSYDVQKRIVGADPDQNIIFKTLLGDKANISGENAGKALQNIAISSLITIDQNYLKADGKTCESEDDSDCGFVPLTCVSNGDGTCTNQGGYIFGDECSWDNCQKAVAAYNEMYVNENMSPSELSKWAGVSKTIKDENGDKQEIYVYNYMFLITTFVGGFMTYIIISFAIDIAVRMFELLVLEVLSPLFIATFVDPKSAQSGPFKNWLNAVGKSYISLYIKLAILALLVLLVSIINQSKIFTAMSDLGGWVKIFAIVGLLIFAKKAPKWIGDIIGIKGDDGLGGLSIGKKLGAMALAGGLAAKGLETGKKALGNKAKRVGAGMVNRLGADIGGTLAGRRSAKRNVLGDKSLRNIRANKMDETGSKFKANVAAVKSFFNKDDRDARKQTLKDAKASGALDLKASGKEARMYARAEATNAALNGKFKSAGSLGSSVKSKFDPNYKTHDQRVQADAAARLYTNQGAFNMAEINRQKKILDDIAETSRIFGQKTYANDKGDIYLDEAFTEPAIYNEKTLKKWVGDFATNYTDLGAGVAFGKDILFTNSERKLTINDNGTLKELTVPAGTLLKENIIEKDGKKIISYDALTKNGEFKDNNGNNVDVKLEDSSIVNKTADGYEIVDKTGKVIMKAKQTKDSSGNIIKVDFTNARDEKVNETTDKNGNIITAASKIIEEYGKNYVGKDISGNIKNDSVLAKQIDAAFASMLEKNAANIVKYESDISSVKKQKIELQTKYTQQQEQILQISNNTEYGKVISKLKDVAIAKQQTNDKLQQFTSWLDSMNLSGNDTINIGGDLYTKDEIEELYSSTKEALKNINNEEYELNTWINNNPDEKTKHDNLLSDLNSSLTTLKEALLETDADIASLEIEKDKFNKEASPLTIDGIVINSNNYNNYSEKLSKDTEKFKKIAEGAIGQAPSSKSED